MLFRYLGGKSVPGGRVLQRACEKLGSRLIIVVYALTQRSTEAMIMIMT